MPTTRRPVTAPPAWVERLPTYTGGLVAFLGTMMLIGWERHFSALSDTIPTLPTMKANTALALAFAGLSLIGRRNALRWTAVVPLLVGAATLIEWASGHSLGIDQLLVRDTFTTSEPGRTSPQIAGALVLFAAARLLSGRRPAIDQIGALATAASSCEILVLELGWIFHAPELTSAHGAGGMSAPTAAGLLMITLGLAGLHAARRPLSFLWDRGLTGTVVRRVLPAVLIGPPTLGMLRLLGENAGWFGPDLGIAMFAGSMMLLLAVAVTITADTIHRAEAERARLSRELEAIFDSVPALLTMRDPTGRLVRANEPAGPAIAGVTSAAVGKPAEELWPAQSAERLVAQDVEVLGTGRPATHTYQMTDAEGIERDWQITKFPVYDDDGSLLGIGAFSLDVTARQEAERDALQAAERLRSYLDSAPDATVIVDGEGIVRYANHQVLETLGYTPEDLVGRSVDVLVPDAARGRHAHLRSTYADHPARRAMGSAMELTAAHRDGHSIPVEISLGPVSSEEGLWVAAAIRDVTARRLVESALREAEQRARHLADHDPLTSIWNRRRFEGELTAVLAELGTERPAAGALMIVDVDHFKAVNDTHGHAMGDELLIAVARALDELVRTTGAASRLGGDEFAVMICVGDRATADAIAADIVGAVAMAGASCGLMVSGSVGACAFEDLDPSDRTLRAALMRADDALYAAKAAGRGRHVLYGGSAAAAAAAPDAQPKSAS